MSELLEIKDLEVRFGGIRAVTGISLNVEEGKIITLIGANGAGKSTVLRSIAGVVKPAGGDIRFGGKSILGLSPDKIVASGITLIPEGRHVFPNLTVLENLKIGAYLRKDNLTPDIEYVYSLFPRLKERHWQLAGTLSGGEQQMLAVGRALMAKPKLIMMDEPFVGLDPKAAYTLKIIMREMCDNGGAIFFSTHVLEVAEKLCDKVAIIKNGQLIRSGTMDEVRGDASLESVFLELED